MKFLIKKSVIITMTVVLVVVAFIVFQTVQPEVPEFSSQVVERIDLTQTVSETGSVEAELELMYGWETSGKVMDIFSSVGASVTTSDVIATLTNVQQQARLREAQAALSSAQAKLNLELAGPSDEARQKSQAAVVQAEASVRQAEASLEKTKAQGDASIVTAEKAVEDAENDLQFVEGGEDSVLVNNAYADLVNDLKSGITKLGSALTESDNVLGIDNTFANEDFDDVLGISDASTLARAKTSYALAKGAKQDAEAQVVPLSVYSDHTTVDSAYDTLEEAFVVMQAHLIDVQHVLQATKPISGLTQSELDTLKTDISTAQASVDTSATNITNGFQAITTARNSLTAYEIAYTKAISDLSQTKKQVAADVVLAEAQVAAQQANLVQAQASYNDLVAPPRNVDVASLRADVARQAANVQALQEEVDKTTLVALTDGVISLLDIDIGENVTANQEVVGIISEGFTIELDVSESDIAKVATGDVAKITLDAYGDDVVFTGDVFSIEPAETEISGVVYYKTTIVLDEIDDIYEVRAGMTANVDIVTDSRDAVIVVPRRAILRKNGMSVVRVVVDADRGIFEERTITVGLVGDDGVVEVVNGLKEGEEVVTFLKEE